MGVYNFGELDAGSVTRFSHLMMIPINQVGRSISGGLCPITVIARCKLAFYEGDGWVHLGDVIKNI